jgi:hypothetical protein
MHEMSFKRVTTYVDDFEVVDHELVKRSTGMSGGETNEHILDCNISEGHDHQSSPSHPPLGRPGRDGGTHSLHTLHRTPT